LPPKGLDGLYEQYVGWLEALRCDGMTLGNAGDLAKGLLGLRITGGLDIA